MLLPLKKKTLETKRAFVRYLSHEIRTPLSIVSMGLKLLQEYCGQSASEEEAAMLEIVSKVYSIPRSLALTAY